MPCTHLDRKTYPNLSVVKAKKMQEISWTQARITVTTTIRVPLSLENRSLTEWIFRSSQLEEVCSVRIEDGQTDELLRDLGPATDKETPAVGTLEDRPEANFGIGNS
jgi:hypothetical protein